MSIHVHLKTLFRKHSVILFPIPVSLWRRGPLYALWEVLTQVEHHTSAADLSRCQFSIIADGTDDPLTVDPFFLPLLPTINRQILFRCRKPLYRCTLKCQLFRRSGMSWALNMIIRLSRLIWRDLHATSRRPGPRVFVSRPLGIDVDNSGSVVVRKWAAVLESQANEQQSRHTTSAKTCRGALRSHVRVQASAALIGG